MKYLANIIYFVSSFSLRPQINLYTTFTQSLGGCCYFKLNQGAEVWKSVCPLMRVPLSTFWEINNYQTPLSFCVLLLVDSEGQRKPKSQSWRPERWLPLNLCRLVQSLSRSHFDSHAQSLSPGFCSSSVWQTTLYRMSSLKDICSGLPLDPLPPNRGRDPNVPHAPIRTPNLTAEEERVSWHTVRLHVFSCVLKGHAQTVKQ